MPKDVVTKRWIVLFMPVALRCPAALATGSGGAGDIKESEEQDTPTLLNNWPHAGRRS
ncbi:hypothetical protein KCP73_23715 [Salmonella enterica subsp. enterica]|nr:hypothetical protein KCP73_23715 [Salmonella enterica subsp. enterica]